MKPTAAQQKAIQASGDILVVAGAGTGKTRTLVDRCLSQILHPEAPVSLLDILMVTFTEAAASEMRERLALSLESALNQQPQNPQIQETLAQVDAAAIGTLHSFCFQLIQQHFHLLGLDPRVRIMESAEASGLCQETLNGMLEHHFASEDAFSAMVRDHVTDYELGRPRQLGDWILKLHHFSQALVDPNRWLQENLQQYLNPSAALWKDQWEALTHQWALQWLKQLESLVASNPHAAKCRDHLARWESAQNSQTGLDDCLERLLAEDGPSSWPRGNKTRYRPPLKKLFEDCLFLRSLIQAPESEADPLQEDWDYHRSSARILLELSLEFASSYRDAKRQRGLLDFADLEQLTLDLLWDRKAEAPTQLAMGLQKRYQHLFVDEYQDINAAQDCILRALSRQAPKGNRFLVGDLKQSIYAFRLASPRYFSGYEAAWKQEDEGSGKQVIYLKDNFRSHPAILDFVNACFSHLIYPTMPASTYQDQVALGYGGSDQDIEDEALGSPRITCRLLNEAADSESGTVEREALATAALLYEFKQKATLIRDPITGKERQVEWRDMAILTRSISRCGATFTRVFHNLGIPLAGPAQNLLQHAEIKDLEAILQVISNPRQDIPLVAVLRSPFFQLDDNTLAWIRVQQPMGSFWDAINRQAQRAKVANPAQPSAHAEAEQSMQAAILRCVTQLQAWRSATQGMHLSQRLEWILDASCYREKILALGATHEALERIHQLLRIARRYNQTPQASPHRFIDFLQRMDQSAFGNHSPEGADSGAVQLMTIHKSKGLEFPIVAVIGLNAPFNRQDSQQAWMMDEQHGLVGMIQPRGSGARYPSLPLWALRKHYHLENLEQEKRLLYVAFTRARDYLLLVADASEKKMEQWAEAAELSNLVAAQPAANTPMDWLFPWLCQQLNHPNWWQTQTGQQGMIRWQSAPAEPPGNLEALRNPLHQQETKLELNQDPSWVERWFHTPGFEYPHEGSVRQPAKAAVTQLKQLGQEDSDQTLWLWGSPQTEPLKHRQDSSHLDGRERGNLYHLLLQFIRPEQLEGPDGLRDLVQNLIDEGTLPAQAWEALDLGALQAFFEGEVGQHLIKHASRVQRELPFTAKFTLEELSSWQLCPETQAGAMGDWIIVQGIVDVAVIQKNSIQILDYKTDQVTGHALEKRLEGYTQQLKLYGRALERIYQRPVNRLWIHLLHSNETHQLASSAAI